MLDPTFVFDCSSFEWFVLGFTCVNLCPVNIICNNILYFFYIIYISLILFLRKGLFLCNDNCLCIIFLYLFTHLVGSNSISHLKECEMFAVKVNVCSYVEHTLINFNIFCIFQVVYYNFYFFCNFFLNLFNLIDSRLFFVFFLDLFYSFNFYFSFSTFIYKYK